jgi:hypothetical protein
VSCGRVHVGVQCGGQAAQQGDGGLGAAEAGAAPVASVTQAPRRLGLVLAVIATAQLMVALDVTVVTGFLKTEGLT